MSHAPLPQAWQAALVAIAREAGSAILADYGTDITVQAMNDCSPLTAADLAAHRVIAERLAELAPDLPLLSEEGADIDWDTRRTWSRYWLVDPLDGTREFVKRNGEFTVNIALIEDGVPVLGVVHAPVLDYLVHARRGVGCWLREANVDRDMALATRRPAQAPLRVAASRSHLDARTARALDAIAEGCADVYPRFGPTSEWDTAAGQCVLEAAGGAVLGLDGQPLRYNRGPSLLNPDFIALGDADLPWKAWIDGLDG